METYHHCGKWRKREANSKFFSYMTFCILSIHKAPNKDSSANSKFNDKLTHNSQPENELFEQMVNKTEVEESLGNKKTKQALDFNIYPYEACRHKTQKAHVIFPSHTVIQPL